MYENEKRENAYLKRKILRLEARNRNLEKLLKQNNIPVPIQPMDSNVEDDALNEVQEEETKQSDRPNKLLE